MTISWGHGDIAGATVPIDPMQPASIVLSPASAVLEPDQAASFTATAYYRDGSAKDVTRDGRWSTADGDVVTVDRSGKVVGVAEGTTALSFALGTASASATITVGDHMCVVLVSIAVSPTNPAMVPGHFQQMTAIGTYSDASTLNITSAVTWTTANGTLAAFNADGTNGGQLECLGGGSCLVTATLGGVSGSTTMSSPTTFADQATGPIPNSIGSGLPAFVSYKNFLVPADVVLVDIAISNRDFVANAGQLTGINIAIGPHDGAGGFVGGVAAAVYLNQTIPASGFLVIPNVLCAPGPGNEILLCHSVPVSVNVSELAPCAYGWITTGTTTVDPLPSPAGAANASYLWAQIRYKTSGRQLLAIGDSLFCGYGYTDFMSTWPHLLAANNPTWGIDIEGRNGCTLAEWADPAGHPFLFDTPGFSNVDLLICLSINDTPNGAAAMKTSLLAIIALGVARGVRRIYAQTIAPGDTGVYNNAARVTYNADILANWASYGLHAAPADVDLALRDPSAHQNLNPPYVGGDATHYNPAGHIVACATWQATL